MSLQYKLYLRKSDLYIILKALIICNEMDLFKKETIKIPIRKIAKKIKKLNLNPKKQ